MADITEERLREIIEGTYIGFDEGAAIAAKLLAAQVHRDRLAATLVDVQRELLAARAELQRMSEWHDQIADTVPCDVAGPHYGIVEWHQIVLAERDAARAQLHADDQRAWETLGKPEGTYDTTHVQRLCAEVEQLRSRVGWLDEIEREEAHREQ